jgi:hypothetical protein
VLVLVDDECVEALLDEVPDAQVAGLNRYAIRQLSHCMPRESRLSNVSTIR